MLMGMQAKLEVGDGGDGRCNDVLPESPQAVFPADQENVQGLQDKVNDTRQDQEQQEDAEVTARNLAAQVGHEAGEVAAQSDRGQVHDHFHDFDNHFRPFFQEGRYLFRMARGGAQAEEGRKNDERQHPRLGKEGQEVGGGQAAHQQVDGFRPSGFRR